MSTKAVTPDSNPAFEQPDLEVPSGDAYDKWRLTGELPSSDAEMEEVEQKQREEEEKAQGPKKAEGAAPSEEEKSVTRAGSEPAKPQTGIKRDENSRIKQLTDSLKREREEKQKLLDKLTAAPVETEKGEKAEESSTRKVDASKATAEPDVSDKNEKGEAKYKTWGEYQKAHDKWVFEEAERRADARFNSRFEETQKTSQEQAELARRQAEFTPRVKKAMEKHSDFVEVAFNKDLPIQKGSFVENYILESEIGPEIAYYLGQNPEELTKITGLASEKDVKGQFLRVSHGMTPAQAGRYLAMLELSLMEDEEPGGEIPAKKPAAKPVTKAPPPPKQVSGKHPQTMSEEAAALEEDDFESYRAAANRREIARRKGK